MKKDLKELISYIIVGGCTTLVNFIIYWLLIKLVYQFFMLRLATLVVESTLLFIFIQLFSLDEMISKIFVSIVTVVSNYVFCKFRIFVKGEEYGQN